LGSFEIVEDFLHVDIYDSIIENSKDFFLIKRKKRRIGSLVFRYRYLDSLS